MMRTIYTPNSNTITFPIPDKYIGKALEINIFPMVEIYTNEGSVKSSAVDLSFGAWSDMENSDEEICAEIRNSRYFEERITN